MASINASIEKFFFATSLQSRNENGEPDSDSDLSDDNDDDMDEDVEFGNRVQCSPSIGNKPCSKLPPLSFHKYLVFIHYAQRSVLKLSLRVLSFYVLYE